MTRQQGATGKAGGRIKGLRTGEVASAAGVNVQTLRYYERRGLLAQPERNASGHRQYPAHTVTLLRMIKNAQRIGLSLDEIADIITGEPNSISPIARRKVAEIDAQIAQLTAIRDALANHIH
jgi:DNA-binding transcriptional MerR regulator